MKAWIQKNLLLLFFVLLFLLGLAAVFGAHHQKSYTATVTETGKAEYHKPSSGRARTKGEYRQKICIRFTDEAGAEQTASFTLRTSNQANLPEVGDTIAVVRWLRGWTVYPNQTAIILGWSCSVIAVIYLVIILYVRFEEIRAWWYARRRKADDPWS